MKHLLTALFALSLLSCQGESMPKDGDKLPPPGSTLINGTPVSDDQEMYWPVVRIQTGNSGCTATVIGKRVVLTAAHCARNGATSRFTVSYGPNKGHKYTAKMTRSPVYPNRDNDIALGYLNKDFKGLPASIDTLRLEVDEVVTLSGYGCVRPGGGGGNDGILREGDSVVVGRNSYDTVTREPGGAALCFGDSGGPMFKDQKLVGVNSKGNIKTTSYLARMDIDLTTDFLEDWSNRMDANICGFNADKVECGDVDPVEPDKLLLENAFYKVEIELKPTNPHKKTVVNSLFLMLLDWLLKEAPLVDPPGDVFLTRDDVVVMPEPPTK